MTESGTVLNGRYELVEPIGDGGMATIWRARDARLGREVAVKLMRPEYGRDPDFVVRFRQEAQSAAASPTRTIVQVFDAGESPEGPFIVMELVAGEDLAVAPPAQRPAPAAPGRPHRRGGRQGARGRARAGDRPPRREARATSSSRRTAGSG